MCRWSDRKNLREYCSTCGFHSRTIRCDAGMRVVRDHFPGTLRADYNLKLLSMVKVPAVV